MKLTAAVERACQEPTLLDALTWIATWECERAIEQAHAYKMTGVSTAAYGGWDTCFRACFSAVMEAWPKKELARKRRSEPPTVPAGQVLYCERCGKKHVFEADAAKRIVVTRLGDIWILKDPAWGVGLACDDCGQRGFLTYPPDLEDL